MTNELVVHGKSELVPATFPDGAELDNMNRIGKMLAMSGYFTRESDPMRAIAQMCVQMLAGRELGLGPFASVQGIHIINGKPSMAANLLAAKVRGHPKYDYKLPVPPTAESCTIDFYEDGQKIGTSIFTAEDARKAQLSTGKNRDTWAAYARNMLFARAISNGVRWFCPDVTSGSPVYVPGELGDEIVDAETVLVLPETVAPSAPVVVVVEPVAAKVAVNGNGHSVAEQFMGPEPKAVDVSDYLPPIDDEAPDYESPEAAEAAAAIVGTWTSPANAQQWAVDRGAFPDVAAARKAWAGMVPAVVGKASFTKADLPALFDSWYEANCR